MKTNYKSVALSTFSAIIIIAIYHFTFNAKQNEVNNSNPELTAPIVQTSSMAPSEELSTNFNTAAENAIHAVVHVKTEFTRKNSYYDDYFSIEDFFFRGQNRVFNASGSGVIISSDGYIVTNNHVVQNADKVSITLNDKRTYDAEIVGTDPSTDIALLKINDKNLPFLSFGNSDNLKIGEWVLAVGNPFNLTSTVTAGIVSAKARNINILGDKSAIESFIQTDAAINPGNSGGALVNIKGSLIGINAAIASKTGYYQGYSFAIPVGIVKKVVHDLKEFGQVQRAVLGVRIVDVNAENAKKLELDNLKGVLIQGVIQGLPAQKAGMLPNDVITTIDHQEVNSSSELLEYIGKKRPGDKVHVEYTRNHKKKESTILLTNNNGNTELVEKEESIHQELGAELSKAPKKVLDQLNIENGVEVKSIKSGLLKRAGIKNGFIITKIDKQKIENPNDMIRIIKSKEGGFLIEGVYRNGIRAYYGLGR